MKDKIYLVALIPICIGEHEVVIVLEDDEILEAITGGADLCANRKACIRLGGASDVPCHGHTTVEFGSCAVLGGRFQSRQGATHSPPPPMR